MVMVCLNFGFSANVSLRQPFKTLLIGNPPQMDQPSLKLFNAGNEMILLYSSALDYGPFFA